LTICIAFVTSHPIQYQVPVFRHLSNHNDVEFSVLFAMLPGAVAQGAGFGVDFEWDIPLLEGYEFKVLENVSSEPSVTHFSGCDTPGILDELRALKPDAVVVNGWVVKTCLQALWACKKLGIPCIVRGEANDLRHRAWWKRFMQSILVRQYAACLYIGQASKAFYLDRGVPLDKLFSAPYCVENERFEKASQSLQAEREILREKWGVPSDSICFLFCGKFETKKHPIELIHAYAEALKKQPHLHLLMVGDGRLRARCEELVAANGMPVAFTGFLNQSEIIAAYVASDCLVLPSDAGETWGLVVNEAMTCGLPAIVSDQVGCAADLISPGETGDVFPFGDWEALCKKIVLYGQSKNRLDEMGQKACQRVQAYSPAAVAVGIRKAVESVVR
jgi:glycosyltransferase involved in cell wall biosynthesis